MTPSAAARAQEPILTTADPLTTGVEIRPLEPGRSVLSSGERHFTIDMPAQSLQSLIDLWARGREDLVGDELERAASPLRALLTELGGSAAHSPEEPARESSSPAGPAPVDAQATSARPEPVAPAGPAAQPRAQDPQTCATCDCGPRTLVTGDHEMVQALIDAAGPAARLVPVDWDVPRSVVTRAFSAGAMLVVALRGAREDDLIDLDRICHDMRVAWLPVELCRGSVWVGPVVTPGVGASYEDAAARRLAAARDPRVHRSLRRYPAAGDQGPGPAAVEPLLRRAAEIVEDARSDLADHDPLDMREGDILHELRLVDGRLEHQRHPVLPVPGRWTRHRTHTVEDLLDERTGLILRIRQIRHDPRAPETITTRQADVSDVRAISPWANNILCQGSTLDDPPAARRAAVGESVERYCGNILDTLPLTWGSYNELRRTGAPVLDPRELVLYSDAQYAASGFPFVPFTRDLRVHWVPGRRVRDDEPVLVPASLVYVNWYSAGLAASPPTNFCSFAGIAAGPDEDFAVRGALEEIIERHATMVWWLNAQPLAQVDGVAGPVLSAPCRASYLHIDNELAVPVAAAVVHDDEDRLVNIGFSARPRFEDAARKALTEALTLQEGSRDLLRSDGLHWAVMAAGELNGRAFKPWRPDRRYLDDFRADMHDCDDLMVQQQVYLDPRAGRRMSHLLEPDAHRGLEELPVVDADPTSFYLRALERHGTEAIVVDITTPDVRSTGLRVVRVIAPGTVGNAPAAFPYLGRRRVQQLAVTNGWREEPLEEEGLNYFPLPHA